MTKDIKQIVENRMAELFEKESLDSLIEMVLEKRIVELVNVHLGAALGVSVANSASTGEPGFSLTWNSPLRERIDSYVNEFFELYLEKKIKESSSRLTSVESIMKIQRDLDVAIEASFTAKLNDLINEKSNTVGRSNAIALMEEILKKMTGLGRNRTGGVVKKAIPQ